MRKGIKKLLSIMLVLAMMFTMLPSDMVGAAGSDKGTPNGAPVTPSLTHDNWSGRADYNITFNIWWGNNATSYKLYENNALIESGDLEANSPNGQSKTFAFSNKANGTYKYKLDLTNSYGTTSSNEVSVEVTQGGSAKPTATPTTTPSKETVESPVFSLQGGTYTSAQDVVITCATSGAQIRYTTDGSNPTDSSALYNGAITVTQTTTIKARAFKTGMKDSSVVSATYTIESGSGSEEVQASEWKAGVSYKIGDVVSYSGKYYQCTFAHTAINGWEPSAAAALWEVYTGPIAPPAEVVKTPVFSVKAGKYSSAQSVAITCETEGAEIRYTTDGSEPSESSALYKGAVNIEKTTTLKAKAFKKDMTASATASAIYRIGTSTVSSLPDHILTGYWQNFDNGAKCLKLSEVPETYNLIAVAFADATTAPGAVDFTLDKDLSKALGGYTKEEFIQDIETVKARGQKVIISVGGQNGTISVADEKSAKNFTDSVYKLITEYGFDGVDIDLENGINAQYMGSALRQLSQKVGPDLIIAMAPQTIDMQSPSAGYFKLALDIKDILTVVNTQFYNSGSMNGQDGKVYSQGSVDFITALAAIQLENGLRPDQVGLGLPASTKGAGSGYVEPSVVNAALNCLATGSKGGNYVPVQTYPELRGVMTWSINWDASNGYNFANSVAPALKALPGGSGSDVEPTKETVKTPVFSVAGGTYTTEQNVTISCVTAGAEIRYTTDGSEPTATSKKYVGAVKVSDTTTLKAKAFKANMNDSATASATYTIKTEKPVEKVAAPVFSVAGGTYTTEQTVAISCATAGAEIRYTTDGTEPDASSALYKNAVKVDKTTTLKAKAFKSGMEASAVVSAVYIIKADSEKPSTDLQKHILIGYWHTWGGGPAGGVPFVKLRDVDENWDVINVAFAEPVSAGSTDGKMKFDVTGLTGDYTKDDFKADIKALQAKGKKIVLSIGGYEGYFSLTSTSAVNQFVSDIKGFVDEYGFDGIDIDLEQSSVTINSGADPDFKNPTSPKVVNMISAIRQICDSYGKDFILSWAPETFYAQLGYQFYAGLNTGCDSRAGVYLPMINALRDKTTYVHVQLYNSMPITASDGKSYSMGNAEAVVAMCKMLLDGFNVGGKSEYFFEPLRADQVVIGVPSSTGAAGSGQISNDNLQKAFNTLVADYPELRGIMTWSINWDAYQNNNSFAISNGQFLHSKN